MCESEAWGSMIRREEGAETLIEQMSRDQDPIIRYGAMFVVGLAYRGTANNGTQLHLKWYGMLSSKVPQSKATTMLHLVCHRRLLDRSTAAHKTTAWVYFPAARIDLHLLACRRHPEAAALCGQRRVGRRAPRGGHQPRLRAAQRAGADAAHRVPAGVRPPSASPICRPPVTAAAPTCRARDQCLLTFSSCTVMQGRLHVMC